MLDDDFPKSGFPWELLLQLSQLKDEVIGEPELGDW